MLPARAPPHFHHRFVPVGRATGIPARTVVESQQQQQQQQLGRPLGKYDSTHTHTHTHTHNRLTAFCPRQPGWTGTRRNTHPLTPILIIGHPLSSSSIYNDPWHPLCSVYVLDNSRTTSLQVLFGLPLGLGP